MTARRQQVHSAGLGGIVSLVLFLFISGCAPVISKKLLTKSQGLRFDEIIKDPAKYQGSVVVFSGVILEAKNTKEGTLFEVLQVPCDPYSRPKDMDKSQGRFLALYKGYLDVAVYSRGREITVGGKITGQRTLKLGEIEYTYPLVEAEEIHLWPVEEKRTVMYCPPPYYLWPPWWYYPYAWPWW